MTAIITQATVVGGHDGRAEIEVEITYDNGGVATISLDEEACTASLDKAGVSSIDELVGRPWSVVLPSLASGQAGPKPLEPNPKEHQHARPRHP